VVKTVSTTQTWFSPNRDNSDQVCDKSIAKQIGARQTETISEDGKTITGLY